MRTVWVKMTWNYWGQSRTLYVYLRDILRDLVKNDDEMLIDLEPLKKAISPSIVIKTHPVFYVLQDACTSDTYDQQLMKNFKGVHRFPHEKTIKWTWKVPL